MKPAYWLLSDSTLDLALKPEHESDLHASLVHALLWEDAALTSDSYLLNNINLRSLLAHNDLFRSIASEPWFVVAARKGQDGRRSSVDQIVQHMLAKGRNSPAMARNDFASKEFMKFAENRLNWTEYSEDALGSRFSSEIVRLFGTDEVRSLIPPSAHRIVTDFIKEKCEAKQHLEQSEFFYEDRQLAALVKKEMNRQNEDFKTRWDEIGKIARAPYITGIPAVLEANPIYAPEHSLAIDLWRKRPAQIGTATGEPFIFETRLGLGAYVEALTLATPDDIHFLRDSDEAKHFRTALGTLTSNSDDSVRELRNAFLAYRHKIEMVLAAKVKSHLKGATYQLTSEHVEVKGANAGAASFLSAVVACLDTGFHVATHIPIPIFGMMLARYEYRKAKDEKAAHELDVQKAKAQTLEQKQFVEDVEAHLKKAIGEGKALPGKIDVQMLQMDVPGKSGSGGEKQLSNHEVMVSANKFGI
jgi:hypothetical protein